MSKLSKTPPNHSWYFPRKPGGSFQLRPRFHQTAFSRFLSGHSGALTFRHGQKYSLSAIGALPTWLPRTYFDLFGI
ncbi:hypothetical protein CEXT_747491 [Caerostris extrusa]|uniref:Uncharacterized protein n=1 Tax=Caerostris extrusa TaxID=172846 RepID=A0AAV4T639_CAEEX|nr:hypothetical protein CEXT_747491 [Caerostris extrusa]